MAELGIHPKLSGPVAGKVLRPIKKTVEPGTAGTAARGCAGAPGRQGRDVRSAGPAGRVGTVPMGSVVPSAWLQAQRVANATAGRVAAALAAGVHPVLGLTGPAAGFEWFVAGRTD